MSAYRCGFGRPISRSAGKHITAAVSCVLHDCNESSVRLLWQTGTCTGAFLNIKIQLVWVITPYRLIPTYRRIVVPSFSVSNTPRRFLWHFDTEDEKTLRFFDSRYIFAELTWCNIPDRTHESSTRPLRENLKSRFQTCWWLNLKSMIIEIQWIAVSLKCKFNVVFYISRKTRKIMDAEIDF